MTDPSNRALFRNPEQGQAMIEVTYGMAVILVAGFLIVNLLGLQIGQIFGDIQCKFKYGADAYVGPYAEMAYCFEDILVVQNETLVSTTIMLGQPLVSFARSDSGSSVAAVVPVLAEADKAE
ncbi:MAG TPA: hypothetical protein VHO69_11735 [Phototrophicaceae bacterium]|nr:hypothetical protein [Phototrophicaceae bacterium]